VLEEPAEDLTLVAGDWHLGSHSPEAHETLGLAFLRGARQAGVRVVLAGDFFEALFEPPRVAERSHPALAVLIDEMAREGRLLRLEGNHDPRVGPARTQLELAGLGTVLVAHGHAVDPLHRSGIGRLGDGISRRFGRLALVRGAAALADHVSHALAGDAMRAELRKRCLAEVDRGGYALGIFGHVHHQHLVPGDRYANCGWLHGDCLEYLQLDRAGVRAGAVNLAGADRWRPAPPPGA
jgi:UDP-2,3-diacylglucosamine pyrophosphatase LpxH